MGVRMSRARVLKLQKLLHMRYKPAEIAEELGLTVDTLYRRYLPAGAPVERDERGRLWIIGDAFARWAESHMAARPGESRAPMTAEEGFCLGCNQVVMVARPRMGTPNSRGVRMMSGRCPVCERKVNRFLTADDHRLR